MDLIYTDSTGKELGIMQSFDLDMEYGSDSTNDYVCTVNIDEDSCVKDSKIYVNGTEYGGFVDYKTVNTAKGTVQYAGRTAHGVLYNRVLKPEPGYDYRQADGDAHEVLADIIEALGLNDIFHVSEEISGIDIDGYQFERNVNVYLGILNMLHEFGAKLVTRWSNGIVELSAEYFSDYSHDSPINGADADLILTKCYRPVNHIVCLGQGDLKDRAVIDIFADENGGIQPYAYVDEPLQDSDYILDQRNKVLSGRFEVEEAYDYPSAAITKNYVLLDTEPDDWYESYPDYFTFDVDGDEGEGSYKPVEPVEYNSYDMTYNKPEGWEKNYDDYFTLVSGEYKHVERQYLALTSKPSDWNSKYKKYYTVSSGIYSSVQAAESMSYKRLTKKPNDWKKNYKNYYVKYSDGVETEYKSVSGITKYKYKEQTRKPTDWDDNYTSYYRHASDKELKSKPKEKYIRVEAVEKSVNGKKIKVAPAWKKKKYITRYSYQIAPKWSDGIYSGTKKKVAPEWTSGKYYQKSNSGPTWAPNTYYEHVVYDVAPDWRTKTYYRELLDRYAVMVAEAIEKIAEAYDSDKLDTNLDESEIEYDVGDLVGGDDDKTGISVTAQVVAKVIKIQNDDISIKYEVG